MQARHGHRLGLEEYERRIIALYSEASPKPSREERRRLERTELDLTIDYRLGTAFPSDRRDALFAVQSRVRRQWLRLLLRDLGGRLLPRSAVRVAPGIPGFMAAEYRKVLDQDELMSFLGDRVEDGRPEIRTG